MICRFFRLSFSASLYFALCRAEDTQSAPVLVSFPNGATIAGESTDGIDSFLGIQYGIVGQRFSRSSLLAIPDNEAAMINATSFGPSCYQAFPELPEFINQARPEAEECLFLNIWRPTGSTAENRLPIMVWIHGGGFIMGSGSHQLYNGGNLAREQNVIVVGINYRLGPLGFLPQDLDGFGAMNGLYDQVIALKWVRANAQSFGGDIEQVTIFGESSGSESVCMLSVSPLTKGLFHRAILQSGDCVYNPWVRGVPNEDMDFAIQAVDSLMNATGVKTLQELQNASLVDAATLSYASAATGGWFVIVLDREVLPKHPRELYLDSSNVVPSSFLIGANSNEDLTFMGMTAEEYLQLAATGLNESAHALVGIKYGPNVTEQVLKAYDAGTMYNGDTAMSFSQLHGDWYIGCPSRAFASDIARQLPLVNIYSYHFAHFAITDPVVKYGLAEFVNTTTWASHMAEIPFVFGTMDFWTPENLTISSKDLAMSKEIMTRWANFAKTGNPNILDTDTVGSENKEFATWEPLSLMSTGSAAMSELRGRQSVKASSEPRVLLFEEGRAWMSNLEVKAKQCSVMPFGRSANEQESLSGGETTNPPENTNGDTDEEANIPNASDVTSGSKTGKNTALWLVMWCTCSLICKLFGMFFLNAW